MKLGDKQRQILSFFYKHKELTKKQIVDEFGHWYYANESKHIGDVLSRMVQRRLIHRPKRGVYKIGRGDSKGDNFNPNQKTLF